MRTDKSVRAKRVNRIALGWSSEVRLVESVLDYDESNSDDRYCTRHDTCRALLLSG